MTEAISGVLDRVNQEPGIDFAKRFPAYQRRRTGRSAGVRVYYRGPRNTPSPASVKFDLIKDELVVCPPILRSISHDYPDVLPPPGQVRCYSFEEVFAEKLRAMGERSRPRKLYDIVNLFRRTDLHPYANLVLEVLEQKCKSKGVLVPSVMNIHSSPMFEELKSETYVVHCPVCGKPFHRVLRSERLRPLREPVGTWNCSGKVRLCGECRMILPAWRDRQSQHPAVSPLALVSNCHLPSGCLYFYGIKRPP